MACSMDDLIEAVCLPGKTFLWAVQWHPEMSLCADEARRKIFEVFIGAINKKWVAIEKHPLSYGRGYF